MAEYPWCRLYNEVLTDRKIEQIRKITKLPRVVIRGAWMTILAMANDSPERGSLLWAPGVPVTDDDLCDDLELERPIYDTLMNCFERFGMIHRDGCIVCTNFSKRQFKSDHSTSRVQAHRARKKAEKPTPETTPCNVSETFHSNAPDTETDTETERETEPPAPAAADTLHPAVQVYEDETGILLTRKGQIEAILDTVDTSENAISLWALTVREWGNTGYKFENVAGMLDWYVKGEALRRQRQPRQRGPPGTIPKQEPVVVSSAAFNATPGVD